MKIFTGLFEDEGVSGIVPSKFEAGGEGGDPDFADRCVRGDHELGFLGFLEEDFELATFAFDIEIELVASGEEALFEFVKSGVGLSLKVFFFEHSSRVHDGGGAVKLGCSAGEPQAGKWRGASQP
jgi:hypothetical protein